MPPASLSPFIVRGLNEGSPAKRRRLEPFGLSSASSPNPSPVSTPTPSSRNTTSFGPSRISSTPMASTSVAGSTILDDEEYAAARRASARRVLQVWNNLEHRYARAMDEDDIVDLRSGRLVQDRGILRAREGRLNYGDLLEGGETEEKDEGYASTDTSDFPLNDGEGEEGEEDERVVGANTAGIADSDPDEPVLAGDPRREESEVEEEPLDDDLFGAWDTVPAPPEEPEQPPDEQDPDVSNDTTISFIYSDVRPKLERLAREREESPLPADDLKAFLAAESKIRAQPGYVEPEDDEVVFLGYGDRRPFSLAQYDRGSDGDVENDGVAHEAEVEESEDELNVWATVPAPAESFDTAPQGAVPNDSATVSDESDADDQNHNSVLPPTVETDSDVSEQDTSPPSSLLKKKFANLSVSARTDAAASSSPVRPARRAKVQTQTSDQSPKSDARRKKGKQPATPKGGLYSQRRGASTPELFERNDVGPSRHSTSPTKSKKASPSKSVLSSPTPKRLPKGHTTPSKHQRPTTVLVPEVVVPFRPDITKPRIHVDKESVSPSKQGRVNARKAPKERTQDTDSSPKRKRKRHIRKDDVMDLTVSSDEDQARFVARMSSLGLHDTGPDDLEFEAQPAKGGRGTTSPSRTPSPGFERWLDENSPDDEAWRSDDDTGHAEAFENAPVSPSHMPQTLVPQHVVQQPLPPPVPVQPPMQTIPFAQPTPQAAYPPQVQQVPSGHYPQTPYFASPYQPPVPAAQYQPQLPALQPPPAIAGAQPGPVPPTFGSGPEALLTQVLYTINYLAYQNVAAANAATVAQTPGAATGALQSHTQLQQVAPVVVQAPPPPQQNPPGQHHVMTSGMFFAAPPMPYQSVSNPVTPSAPVHIQPPAFASPVTWEGSGQGSGPSTPTRPPGEYGRSAVTPTTGWSSFDFSAQLTADPKGKGKAREVAPEEPVQRPNTRFNRSFDEILVGSNMVSRTPSVGSSKVAPMRGRIRADQGSAPPPVPSSSKPRWSFAFDRGADAELHRPPPSTASGSSKGGMARSRSQHDLLRRKMPGPSSPLASPHRPKSSLDGARIASDASSSIVPTSPRAVLARARAALSSNVSNGGFKVPNPINTSKGRG
ncbi:hypothetical protein FRB99_003931 [Tulasnella sp. 403]|nr:hypothetical protein FRB99_003931 [Tulasnella sp. 403]